MPNKLLTVKETELLPLTAEKYAADKCLDLDWLKSVWHVRDAGQFINRVEMPYGGGGYVRYRYANAKKSKPGTHVELYGQEQLIKNGTNFILLPEGESNTHTFSLMGYPVLGVPGVGNWLACIRNNPGSLKLFDGCRVLVVLLDPPSKNSIDHPEMLAQTVADTFPKLAVVKIRLQDITGDKDASDLWKRLYGQHPTPAEAWEAFLETINHAFDKCIKSSSLALPREQREAIKQVKREIADVLASDIPPKLTKWLWKDHVPLHHVTVFAGMPQKGKSTAVCDLIARLTTGNAFPLAANTVQPCEVAILATEDDKDEMIVPRLVAAGANLDRIRFPFPLQHEQVTWEIALDKDLPLLKTYLRERPSVRLLVVDPVTSYIGEVDPNKPKEVRPFLNKLKAFAKEMDITVLLIMHLSKNPDVSALHRVGGAATWIEVPRSVWFFDLNPDQEDGVRPLTYVMVNGKLNMTADDKKKSLEYQFVGVDVPIEGQMESIGRIKWGTESDLELDGLYKKERRKPGPEPKKIEAAMEWLRSCLADGGEYFVTDVFANAEKAGHKPDTLRDAQKRLGIKPHRQFANKGSWLWQLPVANADTGETY
jgi:putative DNA primase/helicase